MRKQGNSCRPLHYRYLPHLRIRTCLRRSMRRVWHIAHPTDLINPKSMLSGSTPVMRKTKHWYLPLNKHEEWLRKWILEEHKEWRPNVYGQCKSWLDLGLQHSCRQSRPGLGIPVPLKGAEGKVLMYGSMLYRIHFKYKRIVLAKSRKIR